MAKIVWDNTGERLYETGTRNGVLYPIDANGEYSNGGYGWYQHLWKYPIR